jgi:hypothetical protein
MKKVGWFVSFAVVAFSVCICWAQAPAAQRASIEIWAEPVEYSIHADSLRDLNFENLKYDLEGDIVKMRGGAYKHRDKPYGGINAELEKVWFFDEKGGVPRHALVWIYVVRYGGSSAPDGYVILFEIRNHILVRTQQFRYDAQAPGTGVSFVAPENKLIITGRSDENVGNCCPKHVDVVTYAWKDGIFLQKGYRMESIPKK